MDVTITLPFRAEHLSEHFGSVVCSIQYQTSEANYRRSRRQLHKSLLPEMSQKLCDSLSTTNCHQSFLPPHPYINRNTWGKRA